MKKPTYTPTLRISLEELVKVWLSGWRWANGDRVAVESETHELNRDGDNVYIMPICEPPTDEQLKK